MVPLMLEKTQILGVVLAGGRSRRFGADKALAEFSGRPLVYHVMGRAMPQVGNLVVSANYRIDVDSVRDLPVIPDTIGPSRGPLAGILAAMEWAAEHRSLSICLATFPVDSPLFPHDLVSRLVGQWGEGEKIVVPARAGRLHPAFGLWPMSILAALRHYLVDLNKSGVEEFARAMGALAVSFDDEPLDPFLNANRPEDLAQIRDAAIKYGVNC